MISFDILPSLVSRINDQYPTSVSLEQWIAPSQWIEGMPASSTPIAECKDVTADERKAIAARVPPYDGVRTWGDLEAVRAQTKVQNAKPS